MKKDKSLCMVQSNKDLATEDKPKEEVKMTKKWVATIALLTATALVGSSIVEARRSGLMPPNCLVTGRDYNRIMSMFEVLTAEVAKLKGHKPGLVKNFKVWIQGSKAQVMLARIKYLEKEIARLKSELTLLKMAVNDPDARRAAVRVVKAKIAKYERELRALKRKLSLLPLRPTARPIVDAAAVRALSNVLTGLTAAVKRLIKTGFRAPELEKRLDRLLTAHKLTQSYLLDVTAELSALRRQLKNGIKMLPPDPGPKPNWAGWHFIAGLEIGYTLFSGAPEYAVPVMANICGEYISRMHIGLEACLKAGVLVTKVQDDTGSFHRVAPFMFGGYLSGAARWSYFGINIPKLEVNYLQSPITGEKGLLWVNIYGGVQLTIAQHLVLGMDLGTSLHSEAAFLGGFHMRWFLRGRY
ncbi:MAG: hypothetical protein ABID64_03770 [Nitrospirota bacterium]